MMKNIFSIIGRGAIGIALLIKCVGYHVENIAGTGTLIGNPSVAGMLYNVDGSFAKNATVHIRKRSFLPDISHLGLAKHMVDTASTVTNDSGQFAFDTTLDTGIYVIEAMKGDYGALIDSIIIKNKDSTIVLPQDTLQPLGAIKGAVRFPDSSVTVDIYIGAFGIDTYAHVNSDGSFALASLPEGAYQLQLLVNKNNLTIPDTTRIKVNAAETTDAKIMKTAFTGSPLPKKAWISYDTLNQLVTLRWSNPDTSQAKSFKVYRRYIDSTSVYYVEGYNGFMADTISDTVYIDSTVVQDQTYEYCIAAIGKNGLEGEKGSAMAITIASNFVLDTVYEWDTGDMAFAENGDIYTLVGVCDSTMRLKREWSKEASGSSICTDERGRIFIRGQHSVFVCDTTGNILDTIAGVEAGDIVIRGGLKAKDSLIFALNFSPLSVNVFSYQAIKQHTWKVPDSGDRAIPFYSHLMTGNSNEIMVSTPTQIISYDYSGNKISEIALPDSVTFRGCFSFNQEKRLLYFIGANLLRATRNRYQTANTLYIMNGKNSIIALYKIPPGFLYFANDLWVQKNGTVYFSGLGRSATFKLKPLF